jgi:GT2 family glycosyltransferase
VSVVVPVFNNWALTRACLGSLVLTQGFGDMEVIVVDDASTDATQSELEKWIGVRVIKNDVNEGFNVSASRGAEAARGAYILFLNNDTLVFPDAIGWLLRAFADDQVAAVGARLVYPNGKLAEAGAYVDTDGYSHGVGRHARATHPRFCVPRDVPYCSAAALMVTTSVFRRVGGFDPEFAPAYYEDADLCFAVRAAGLRVRYEPRAVVIHRESMTHGSGLRDPVSGASAKGTQAVNRARFLEKWGAELSSA